MRKGPTRIVAVAVMCLFGVLLHSEESPRQRIKKILSHAAKQYALSDKDLGKFKEIDQPIAVLADFLEDKKLSVWAADAMMRLDPTAAAPIFVQKAHNIDLKEDGVFEYYLKEGLTNSMPWRSDLHQLALRVLQAAHPFDDALQVNAIHMLGLTGDGNDIPLLEKIYDHRHGAPNADGREIMTDASETALARLGSVSHLDNIESDLRATLLFEKLKEKSFWQVEKQTAAIYAAGISGNKRFVPLLCQHLQDSLWFENDILQEPGFAAETALSLILDHKFLPWIEDGKLVNWKPYWENRCNSLQ